MRLLLLLLISAFHLAPASCQSGGLRVGRSTGPSALRVLQDQADAFTSAAARNDIAAVKLLFADDLEIEVSALLPSSKYPVFGRASSAKYVGEGVEGIMDIIYRNSSKLHDSINIRLEEDHTTSPTGWKIVKVISHSPQTKKRVARAPFIVEQGRVVIDEMADVLGDFFG